MNIDDILKIAVESKASDVHIVVAVPPTLRINGKLFKLGNIELSGEDTKVMVESILTPEQKRQLDKQGEVDLSYSSQGIGRFRINAYKQRGSYGMAIRVGTLKVPTIDELGLPEIIKELAVKNKGLILVTGPTGSGKSTTLAAMIDYINNNKSCHVLTLEDPIEYLHKHNKSLINQREIGYDTTSFADALRAGLRQDPDVILVGEMRDFETISIALTAAETGHLVMSTLHTIGAVQTIDRIIDVFPPYQQQQARVQLASVLEGVISQQLLPTRGGKSRVAAFEIMLATNAIRNLIREGKTHQIQTAIQTGTKFGMQTMDYAIGELFRKDLIDKDTAITYAVDQEMLQRYLWM